jgi:ubiquinone/menaquinone biosynthesis C-methylase UbiE
VTLEHVRRTYEEFGDEDPFFAVLSARDKRGGGWDPEEFFATGVREIGHVLAYLDELGVTPERGRALDFGCGVGRLSQALAEHFDEVVGVDISSSMVRTADEHNRHGERVRYVVNTAPDLSLLPERHVDFIYSNITLQHMPGAAAEGFVRDFFRVLRPGGIAVFQIPDGRPFRRGSLGDRVTNFVRGPLRRWSKRIRGKKPVEIHYVARPHVERAIAEQGGRLLDVFDIAGGRKRWGSLRYCARKEPTAA